MYNLSEPYIKVQQAQCDDAKPGGVIKAAANLQMTYFLPHAFSW